MQKIIVTTSEELQEIINSALHTYLNKLQAIPATDNSAKEIINEQTLCTRLNITLPTASRWRRRGRLPFLQIGSSIRYDYNAVIKALENKKSKV